MRSKLGTRSRLAAHLTALVLLIMMLVYVVPPSRLDTTEHSPSPVGVGDDGNARQVDFKKDAPPELTATPDTPAKPDKPALAPEVVEPESTSAASAETVEPTAPPSAPTVPPSVSPGSAQYKAVDKPVQVSPAAMTSESEKPPRETIDPVHRDAVPQTPPQPSPPATGEIEPVITERLSHADDSVKPIEDSPRTEMPQSRITEDPGLPPSESDGKDDSPAKSGAVAATTTSNEGGDDDAVRETISGDDTPDKALNMQPDESGSIVVASSDGGAAQAAITPLPDANLEELGDNVFWLDPKHDLEKELAAIPEVGTLVLLTPMHGYWAKGFEHIRTETIPADIADLSDDAAAHFLHLTSEAPHPVIVAALPGARGAAFFKGVYLLARRKLNPENLSAAIAPELDDASYAAEEILHRLRRLDVTQLK